MPSLPNASTSVDVDGRTSRTRDYVAGPIVVGPKGDKGDKGDDGADGYSDDLYRANAIAEFGCVADGATDDTSALNAALASGAPLVYLPPGTYKVNGAVTGSAANQCVRLAPGAKLRVAPATGSVVFSGAQQRLEGLSAEVIAASSTTFNAITVSGTGTVIDGGALSVSADVPNCTLLKIEGEAVHVPERVTITSAGKAFKYGVHVEASNGGELDYVTMAGIHADVGDDGADVTFGALLYTRGKRSSMGQISIEAGGRAFFPDGVVIVDGHFNSFQDPYVLALKAKYGFYLKDGAEFCYIRGGWIQQRAGDMASVLADSEGIRVGHNCDHLSLKDVTCTGFDYGLGFHGSNNIPNLDGFDASNNKTAAILIDSEIAGEAWPISGLSMTGCYAENAATGSQPIYIWAKTGQVLGGVLLGAGSLGYETYFIKIETAFAAFTGFKIDGNRIIALDNTGAGILPNVNTDIVWGDANDTERSNTISSGTYASKVRQSRDPLLNGVTVGSNGTRVSKYFSDVYTLNFNANPEVGQIQDVVATVAGVAVGDQVAVSVPDSHVFAAAGTGDVYFAWVSSAGHVTVRRQAGAHFTPGSGSFRISYWQH